MGGQNRAPVADTQHTHSGVRRLDNDALCGHVHARGKRAGRKQHLQRAGFERSFNKDTFFHGEAWRRAWRQWQPKATCDGNRGDAPAW